MNVIFDFINQSSVATSRRLRLSIVKQTYSVKMCLFTIGLFATGQHKDI